MLRSKLVKHSNAVSECGKCLELFRKFPGFFPSLEAWFFDLRKRQPEAHISIAGRGRTDQERAFKEHASRAHFGESAHNYNMAIDLFCYEPPHAIFSLNWYARVVGPAVANYNGTRPDFPLTWSGDWPNTFEYAHVEVRDWKNLKLQFPLVE